MALYKYDQFLIKSSDPAFDRVFLPGTAAPYAGIFRCASCGDEIALPRGHIFPPQNHKQHNPASGPIHWQLVVFPVQK